MSPSEQTTPDYSRPVEIAEQIFWVGFFDAETGLHCNPYLILDHGEAVVIDGGSRPDFPSVMMKILSTGIDPSSIGALIYQHYDPDLCGSIANFEDIIDRSDLKIISARSNHMFIRHYAASVSRLYALDELGHRFRFASGRELRFTETPFAHSGGSFVTFDEKTGVLFSSDLFGSYGKQWELFLRLTPECAQCRDHAQCPQQKPYCPLPDILQFHQRIMPSVRTLRFALEQVATIPFSIIAPQHGSVIRRGEDIRSVWDQLATLTGVGIDGLIGSRSEFDLALPEISQR